MKIRFLKGWAAVGAKRDSGRAVLEVARLLECGDGGRAVLEVVRLFWRWWGCLESVEVVTAILKRCGRRKNDEFQG